LLSLFFYPEDGDKYSLRNVGWLSTEYTGFLHRSKTDTFITTVVRTSSRSQWPRSLEHWGRGLESHSRNGCLCVRLFCVCVVLCVRSCLATGRSPVQGVLPSVYRLWNWKSGSNKGV
jgi:hypothetical protein